MKTNNGSLIKCNQRACLKEAKPLITINFRINSTDCYFEPYIYQDSAIIL